MLPENLKINAALTVTPTTFTLDQPVTLTIRGGPPAPPILIQLQELTISSIVWVPAVGFGAESSDGGTTTMTATPTLTNNGPPGLKEKSRIEHLLQQTGNLLVSVSEGSSISNTLGIIPVRYVGNII